MMGWIGIVRRLLMRLRSNRLTGRGFSLVSCVSVSGRFRCGIVWLSPLSNAAIRYL